jgi:hypothetical protein
VFITASFSLKVCLTDDLNERIIAKAAIEPRLAIRSAAPGEPFGRGQQPPSFLISLRSLVKRNYPFWPPKEKESLTSEETSAACSCRNPTLKIHAC